MKIHPSAIIDPTAKIDESVEVGPFSVIDGGVEIGAGTVIESSVRIYSGVSLGKDNLLQHACVLGGDPQHLTFDRSVQSFVKIGDRNRFREHSSVERAHTPGGSTTIGNDNYFMEKTHIAHDCVVGNHVILTHTAALAGHAEMGDGVFMSAFAGIHQYCRVGRHSMIAGLAKVVKDVPPFTTADGNPCSLVGINALGLKRAGYTPEQRARIRQTYKTIFHARPKVTEALQKLENEHKDHPEVLEIITFFRSSERGVMRQR